MSGLEGLLAGHTLVGRYRIEEVIGRGGFAAVYRATDERLERTVAVKVIVAPAVDADTRERLRARFHREARAVAGLQHPNVVTVYDFGTDPALGLDFLVMELLRGEDLAARLERAGPPPLAVAVRILRDAAEGVAAGHRNGLVHRDVKPGNVFLAEGREADGFRVCVLDFGIAKAAAGEETATHLTRAGEGFLSPAYASPEQLRGERELGPASDVFSLGVIGYEMLAGERPFARDRLTGGVAEPAPPVREVDPAVPAEIAGVVTRALAPDAAARWVDAGAFAAALRAAEQAVGTLSAVRPAPLPAPPPPPEIHAAPPPSATVRVKRNGAPSPPAPRRVRPPRTMPRGGAWGAALLLLLLAGAAIWLAARDDGERDRSDRVKVALDEALAEPDSLPAASTGPAQPQRSPRPVPAAASSGEPAPTTGDAGALNREGERRFAAGDYAAAVDAFERASGAAPENAYFRNNLGWALFRMGATERAGRVLEETIRLDPARDIAYANLGEVRLAQGDTAAAVAEYRRFLERNSDPRRERIARDKLRRIGGDDPR